MNLIKKVVRASAGTGKTYRLSLEFINLLLSFKEDVSFEEILVITFTKKATAEIRERIFQHLSILLSSKREDKKEKGELIENLKKINCDLEFSRDHISFLHSVYSKMLTNKHKLNISTIDSFLNNIFSGLVAPYKNITDYSIDPNINENYLPELFDEILKRDNFAIVENIFKQKKGKNISIYESFIKSIINNRWLFYQADKSEKVKFSKVKIEDLKKKYFLKFKKIYAEVVEEFYEYLKGYLKEKIENWIAKKFL